MFFIIVIILAFILRLFLLGSLQNQDQLNPIMQANTTQVLPFSVLATIPPPSTITRVQLATYNEAWLKPTESTSRASRFVLANSDATEAVNLTLKSFFDATLADCFQTDTAAMTTAKAWLYIAITKSYSHHRWHRDSFPSIGRPGQVLSRYSTVLVGPPTLVLCPCPEVDAVKPEFGLATRWPCRCFYLANQGGALVLARSIGSPSDKPTRRYTAPQYSMKTGSSFLLSISRTCCVEAYTRGSWTTPAPREGRGGG